MTKSLIHINKLIKANPPKNNKYYLVAIDGRGGAGKSTLSVYIQKLLSGFSLISGDAYFEPIKHPIAWGGYNEERFDKDVIKPLKNSLTTIDYQPYDWDQDPHIIDRPVSIDKGIIIERCYSFAFDLNYDLKVWVETPRDISLNRGINRSTMPEKQAEKVWREIWKPMEDKYILAQDPLKTADVVIDGTEEYSVQLAN
jgi:uridine kinase